MYCDVVQNENVSWVITFDFGTRNDRAQSVTVAEDAHMSAAEVASVFACELGGCPRILSIVRA